MALGTIGVLLIIVIGIATLYINEMRLSRISYDEVVASASAEWAFEYGMLKVRNHREGFEDELIPTDPDGGLLSLSSDRSKNMKTSYIIKNASSNSTFSVEGNKHLIIPLFASDESLISWAVKSKKAIKNPSVRKVQWLQVSGLAWLSWTIVAMSWSQSVWLSWNGDITITTQWKIRERAADCYDSSGTITSCLWAYAEILEYFYDTPSAVWVFLMSTTISSPYLMVYNPSGTRTIRVQSSSTTPFALPEMTIEASAQKNKSLQIFRFTEDKSRYYDALKYGIYNNQ
jgi:hypothetical protein